MASIVDGKSMASRWRGVSMAWQIGGVAIPSATIRAALGGKCPLPRPKKEKARLLLQRALSKAGPAT